MIVREKVKKRKKCGIPWWFIVDSVNGVGGFSFGCFLIIVLKCFIFCDRRAKEFKVSSIW